ncbi:MAG: hypothetical protein IJF09_02415 [Ruminiclostridium sp.]|nr:hypothetical protein [Ruminiclostridium sp.]
MKMNKETFNYTYSAGEQEEIRRIREKYQPREADKMEQLRRLDESATHKGTAISVWVGIIGTLLMGFGMSCCMVLTDLFILGIVVGVIGIITLSLAYPLYNYITKKERERIAPAIIRLTDELLK